MNIDRVLGDHGLGKATPLSAALVAAFLATVTTALRELARFDDVAHGPDPAVPIEDLGVSSRAYNCLKRDGVHTIADLFAHRALPDGADTLMTFRNLGAPKVREVPIAMSDHGIEHPDLASAGTQDWWDQKP